MPRFLLIGMNAFGRNLALELLRRDEEVVVIDKSRERINRIRHDVPDAVRLDATDRDALQHFDVTRFDHVVVCMGHQFEAAERATLALSDLGAQSITNLATTRGRRDILKVIGAHKVVAPGLDLARNLAVSLCETEIESFIFLDEQQGLAELVLAKRTMIPEAWSSMLGPGTRVVGARRVDKDGSGAVELQELGGATLDAGDRLLAIGRPELLAERIRKLDS